MLMHASRTRTPSSIGRNFSVTVNVTVRFRAEASLCGLTASFQHSLKRPPRGIAARNGNSSPVSKEQPKQDARGNRERRGINERLWIVLGRLHLRTELVACQRHLELAGWRIDVEASVNERCFVTRFGPHPPFFRTECCSIDDESVISLQAPVGRFPS